MTNDFEHKYLKLLSNILKKKPFCNQNLKIVLPVKNSEEGMQISRVIYFDFQNFLCSLKLNNIPMMNR